MARLFRTLAILSPAAVMACALLTAPAFAAGPFDGTWIIDLPSSPIGGTTTTSPCPALRLRAQIVDNRVTGRLEYVPSGTTPTIEPGTGRASSPIIGTVQADGTVSAEWEGFRANGTLNGDTGSLTVQGQCGPRPATVTRVAK